MKKQILLLFLLLLILGEATQAQWTSIGSSWTYNFTSGTSGIFSTTATLNLSSDADAFLPAPPSGTSMLFIASDASATFNLDAAGNKLTTIPASSSNNKFTTYNISGATDVAEISFGVTLDSIKGSTLANNLAYVWSIGNSNAAGNPYISKNAVNNASTAFQSIFTALRALYSSAKNQYVIGYRSTTTSTTATYTTLGGGALYGGIHYAIFGYCNNSTNTQDYTGPDGKSYTVAAASLQLWSVNTATSEIVRYHITGNVFDIPRSVETVTTTGDQSILDNTPLNAFAFQGSSNAGDVAYEIIDGGISLSYVGSVLPVSFISNSFTAQPIGQSVRLSWETASEQNNAYFEILHSSDGNIFNSIGKVPGNQTSSLEHTYSFLDNNPNSGKNYYKLEQVDIDGKITYNSSVVVVNGPQFQNAFNVYVSGDQLKATAHVLSAGNAAIQVFSIAGQQLINTPVQLNKGGNQFTVNVSSLQPGVYIAVIKSKDHQESVQFIK